MLKFVSVSSFTVLLHTLGLRLMSVLGYGAT